MLFSFPKRLFHLKKLIPTNSETSGDSKNVFLHCGDVNVVANWIYLANSTSCVVCRPQDLLSWSTVPV